MIHVRQSLHRLLVTAAVVAFSTVALADEVLFTIRSATDPAKLLEVTDTMVASLPSTTYKTTLPGGEYTMHDVRGPLMRDLIKAAGLSGETATAVALDKYEIEIPLSDFDQFDVIAAIEVDGKRLSVREKGPAWIVYPVTDNPSMLKDPVYEARSIWQLKEIAVK